MELNLEKTMITMEVDEMNRKMNYRKSKFLDIIVPLIGIIAGMEGLSKNELYEVLYGLGMAAKERE